MRYERLKTECVLQEETEQYIDRYLDYLNNGGDPRLDDCQRTEIDCCLRWEFREGYISADAYGRLKDYYVHGGICGRKKKSDT